MIIVEASILRKVLIEIKNGISPPITRDSRRWGMGDEERKYEPPITRIYTDREIGEEERKYKPPITRIFADEEKEIG